MSCDWIDIIYLVGIPLVQQVLKLISEKFGLVLVKWHNQLLTLVLAVAVGVLGGDFLGISWCGWSEDLMAFIGCNLAAVAIAWAAVSGIYEALWDKIFVKVKVSTLDKL